MINKNMIHCPICNTDKEQTEFNKCSGHTNGLQKYCRTCQDKYYVNHKPTNYRKNKGCAQWLGVHVAESVLSKLFKNVERAPLKNPGYDFKCGKGYLIDCKSSCLHPSRNSWGFNINKNQIADYFLCLAFDNREDLNPLHIWLIPGEVVNDKTGIAIVNLESVLSKWSQYERLIEEVVTCCQKMKATT